MDNVFIGTAFSDQVRFYLADTKEIASTIIDQAAIYPISLIVLANTIGITGIMGLMEKGDTEVCSVVNGDGLCGKIIAKANTKGEVKGLVSNRYVDLPLVNGSFNIIEGVGQIGNVEITKDYHMKTPFMSETSIIKGDILSDFSYYFSYSQQTPTAISGGVNFDEEYNVNGAGILIVQILPNCPDEVISELEQRLVANSNLSHLLATKHVNEILQIFFDLDFKVLETKGMHYQCNCSYDRCLDLLATLPPEDRKEIKEDETIEMLCDWCLKKYDIKTNDIE